MKYMTFNSSCAYAGLANLLEFYGVETEDYLIAQEIALPYCFAREGGVYQAGPMLQGKRWFELYLRPRGFNFNEVRLHRERAADYLAAQPCAMVGIWMENGQKHAVVYSKTEAEKLCFLNNKRRDSDEPEQFVFSRQELEQRLEADTPIATLGHCDTEPVSLAPVLESSLAVFQELQQELLQFCSVPQSPADLAAARDRLFRPILLDALSVLPLAGEWELCKTLGTVQKEYLRALRQEKPVVLAQELPMGRLEEALELYQDQIEIKLKLIQSKEGITWKIM